MKKIFTVNFLLRSFVKSHDYNLIKHTTNQQVNEKSFKIEKIVNWKKKIFLYRFKDNNTNERVYKTIYLKDDVNMGMSTTSAFYYARKLLLKKRR